MKELKKGLFFLVVCLTLIASVSAQTPVVTPTPPTVNNFSFSANAIALPGGGHTAPGTLIGGTLNITPNFALRQTNFVATGSDASGFYGGVNYVIPKFSSWLDKKSPNLAGYDFQLYLTASVGVDRISPPGMETKQHYSFMAGGGLNYKIKGSDTYLLVAEVQYAKLPGLANNTFIVVTGPMVRF